ncbi:hypothetical protein VCHC59B1_0409, partial [Vibrio cholerae HC-59B1]
MKKGSRSSPFSMQHCAARLTRLSDDLSYNTSTYSTATFTDSEA